MNLLDIAAQMFTVREFTKTPEDIEKSLRKIKEIGYRAIQVSGFGPIAPERLKELALENALTICATHIPADRIKNDTEAVIREHLLWGCHYVGLGSMPHEFRTSKEGFLAFAREYSEYAKKIADHGLSFVYHNHKFEFEKFDGRTGMDILLEVTDPETFGFEIDTYWVQAGGANPVDWIKKVAGRMGVVHLKDMAIKANEQIFAEIGQGNLDWQPIIQACRETGVQWYAVEQDKTPGDPFESLANSLAYLKKFC